MSPIHSTVTAALLLAGLPLAPAVAQSEPPQVARYKLMERNGDAAKILGAMAKGEREYDGTLAAEQLDHIIADMKTFVTLFPEGSETGHDTRALPAIWENRAGFEEDADDLVEAAQAAKAASADGLDAFRPAFGAVGKACGACHETFRAEKS